MLYIVQNVYNTVYNHTNSNRFFQNIINPLFFFIYIYSPLQLKNQMIITMKCVMKITEMVSFKFHLIKNVMLSRNLLYHAPVQRLYFPMLVLISSTSNNYNYLPIKFHCKISFDSHNCISEYLGKVSRNM
jgi:HJR/Mrr/RecB family endonuclease